MPRLQYDVVYDADTESLAIIRSGAIRWIRWEQDSPDPSVGSRPTPEALKELAAMLNKIDQSAYNEGHDDGYETGHHEGYCSAEK